MNFNDLFPDGLSVGLNESKVFRGKYCNEYYIEVFVTNFKNYGLADVSVVRGEYGRKPFITVSEIQGLKLSNATKLVDIYIDECELRKNDE